MENTPHQFLLQYEKRLVKKLSVVFAKTAERLATALESNDTRKFFWNDIERILEEENGIVVEVVADLSKPAMKKWMEVAKYVTWVAYSEISGYVTQYFDDWKGRNVKNQDGSISKTTSEKVAEVVSDGVKVGKSYTEIAKDIREQVKTGVFSKSRAELIAVNSIGNAFEEWQRKNIEYANMKTGIDYQKRWSTVGDLRVTRECNHNESQGWIDFRQAFDSGDQRSPRYGNPRCRCTVQYRAKDIARSFGFENFVAGDIEGIEKLDPEVRKAAYDAMSNMYFLYPKLPKLPTLVVKTEDAVAWVEALSATKKPTQMGLNPVEMLKNYKYENTRQDRLDSLRGIVSSTKSEAVKSAAENSIEKLMRILPYTISSDYSGHRSTLSTIYHEFAHYCEFTLMSGGVEVDRDDLYKKRNNLISSAMKTVKSNPYMMSEYARVSEEELIAEGFALYFLWRKDELPSSLIVYIQYVLSHFY